MSADSANTFCTVCIANYNGKEVIDDCLRSVFAQDCDFLFEVIVHDDASSDNSMDIVRERYPMVKVITSEENVGFCISNNRMVEIAAGQNILLLNNDAVLFPDALRTLHEHTERQINAGIVGLSQYDIGTKKLIDMGSLCDLFLNPIPNLDSTRRDVAMVCGACLWVSKGLWVELGGLPAWFGSLAEDMHLCTLARLRGYPVQVLATSGYFHHVGKSLGGGRVQDDNRLVTNKSRRALSERNKSRVMILTYPAPLLQTVLPIHLFLLVLEGALLAMLKWDWNLFIDIYLSCLQSLWSQREMLYLLRCEIQAERTINCRSFLYPFQILPYKLRLLYRHGLPDFKKSSS